MTGRALALHVVLAACAALFAWNHAGLLDRHAGYVPAAAPVPAAHAARALNGRVVVILLDGVGQRHAASLSAAARLADAGTCWPSRALLPSMSRPNYVALSTGVPPSHSGVRGNLDASPVALEHVWGLARAAGRNTRLVAEEDWWSPVMPGAFDQFVLDTTPDALPGPDITLWHVLETDHAAHAHGTASAEFAAALRDADARIGAVMEKLDFSRDVLFLTADHGHRARGGHGGDQAEAMDTLTCAAGPEFRRVALARKPATFHAWVLARSMGIRPPAQAHAGPEDEAHLAALTGPLSPLDLAALESARTRWRGVDLYATASPLPLAAAWLVSLVAAAWLMARRSMPPAALLLPPVACAWWCTWTGAADLSAVNTRLSFSTIVVTGALLPVATWLLLRPRDYPSARASLPAAASVFTTLLVAVHALVVGLPPSPPLPHPVVLFLPLPLSMCVATWSASAVFIHAAERAWLRLGVAPRR